MKANWIVVQLETAALTKVVVAFHHSAHAFMANAALLICVVSEVKKLPLRRETQEQDGIEPLEMAG